MCSNDFLLVDNTSSEIRIVKLIKTSNTKNEFTTEAKFLFCIGNFLKILCHDI